MAVETKIFCPLGKECESVKDGIVHRCAWFQGLRGKDPQSEKEIDEEACAISWLPLLATEIAQTNRGQTQAIESFRNETVKLAHNPPNLRLNNAKV